MKFVIETISGRKGIKHFADLNEYVDFMTNNGHKIKTIYESELPYSDKPVKLSKVSKSNGWEQIDNSAFGGIADKAEKGDCVLPKGKQGVFKNNASFEVSKPSESVKDEADDLPKFEYKDEDESKEEKKEKVTKSENKKEEKKINESLEDESKNNVRYILEIELDNTAYGTYADAKMYIVEPDPYGPNGMNVIPQSDYSMTYIDYYWENIVYSIKEKATKIFGRKNFETFINGVKEEDFEYPEYDDYDDELDEVMASAGVKLNEGIVDMLKAGYRKLTGTPDEKEIPELVNEYLVYTFLDVANRVDFSHYEWIVKKLTKADKNFAKVAEKVRVLVANQLDGHLRTRIEKLKQKLIQLGIDKEIVEKAYQTFMDEELQPKKDKEKNPQPQEPKHDENQLNLFDHEIRDALRAAGIQLNEEEDLEFEENVDNPDDGDIDEKSGKEKLFEEEPLEEAPMSDEEFDSLEDGDKINWDVASDRGNFTVKKDGDKLNFIGDDEQGNMFNMDKKADYVKGYFSKGHKAPLDKDSVKYAEDQVKAWEEAVKMAEYDDFGSSNGSIARAEEQLSAWKRELEKRRERDGQLTESEEEILDETKPARFNQHLDKDKSFANISASRSNDEFEKPGMEREKQLQSEENNRKTEELKKDIKDLGLSYIKTYGAWRDTGATTQEDSFLIPNITKEQALELGKKYGQYSVIFKDKGEDTAYMYITLDNEDFGKEDMAFDMSGNAKFNQVKQGKDELEPYSGYTGLKPGGKGYNLSYKVK